jgi:hypothetical protein
VKNGVSLTIEAGATVNLNNYYVQVEGTLSARGSSTDQINFNRGVIGGFNQIRFESSSISWNEQTSSGCIIENAVGASISISNSSPKINNCVLYKIDFEESNCSPVISNNIIKGSITFGMENIVDGSPVISNNTITSGIGHNYGTSIYTSARAGSPII